MRKLTCMISKMIVTLFCLVEHPKRSGRLLWQRAMLHNNFLCDPERGTTWEKQTSFHMRWVGPVKRSESIQYNTQVGMDGSDVCGAEPHPLKTSQLFCFRPPAKRSLPEESIAGSLLHLQVKSRRIRISVRGGRGLSHCVEQRFTLFISSDAKMPTRQGCLALRQTARRTENKPASRKTTSCRLYLIPG